MARWEHDSDDRPLGPGFDLKTVLLFTLTMVVIIGGLFWVGAGDADAEQRDYADLPAAELPHVDHVEFDGNGHAHVAGHNPGPHVWLAATFHVPDPATWHDGQVDVDSIGVPVGTFDLILDCSPGAAQVDLWLPGQDQPYAADTTLDCGTPAVDTADEPLTLAPASTTTTSPTVAVDSGEAGTPPTPPEVGSPPAAPNVGVRGVQASRLAVTGSNNVGALIVLGACLFAIGGAVYLITRHGKGGDAKGDNEPLCDCGHSRDAHDEQGRCDACLCPGFTPIRTGEDHGVWGGKTVLERRRIRSERRRGTAA